MNLSIHAGAFLSFLLISTTVIGRGGTVGADEKRQRNKGRC